MDHSTFALRPKEGSSVPARQVPTASQPQSAAVGRNTPTTIGSSARTPARTPAHPNAPAPRVRPWTEARVVAPNTYHEGYTVPVIQPTSGLLAVATETSAVAPNVPGYHASYCEYTKEYFHPHTLKVVTIPVSILNGRLAAFNPGTREFDVVTTVLALIDQRDPNYALRVKQREQANRLTELVDGFLKHKVTSETDVPSYRFPYEPRKIAHLKKPAANQASSITGANKASAQPSVSPGVNHMPIFGRSGGGAAPQPGASPFFHFKIPDFGGRDAGIRRFPKE
ncbi:hypothetical protein DSL72_001816 [Monilinia vaccinii-corymbosi]|uniref:Uncharacterized protein n=1 Tax=Monilinia vaccinii-corymbosi TaxID=61207 RepID=A0A8A3PAV5_9HELO|nr:hypothetical protein DSL72_001816 [Monilinia vaccinii-corymbosi]